MRVLRQRAASGHRSIWKGSCAAAPKKSADETDCRLGVTEHTAGEILLSAQVVPCVSSVSLGNVDTIRVLDLQPSRKNAVETMPAAVKKIIGCHVPCRTLKAANRTTTSQLLANFQIRTLHSRRRVPDVLPTASDASSPITTATYNHSCLTAIIEKMSASATANGVHGINRSAAELVCSVVDIDAHFPRPE